MRRGHENKAVDQAATAVAVKTCPRCGSTPSAEGCRQVRHGWYCQARGLSFDPAAVIAPAPDPIAAAVAADPAVQAARAVEDAALNVYEGAEGRWIEAVRAATARRAKARRGRGLNVFGAPVPSPDDDAVASAFEAKERAGRALQRARVACGETYRRAEHRARQAATADAEGPADDVA